MRWCTLFLIQVWTTLACDEVFPLELILWFPERFRHKIHEFELIPTTRHRNLPRFPNSLSPIFIKEKHSTLDLP